MNYNIIIEKYKFNLIIIENYLKNEDNINIKINY